MSYMFHCMRMLYILGMMNGTDIHAGIPAVLLFWTPLGQALASSLAREVSLFQR